MVLHRVRSPFPFRWIRLLMCGIWFKSYSGGAHEIAECMAKYILSRSPNAITFSSRVTSIALNTNGSNPRMDVVTNNTDHHQFSHVISTIPLPVLRTIDLSQADLSVMQSNALRELNYGPSVKIGLQFKTAWWTTGTDLAGQPLNIVGGQSYTDTPLRTIVYPSFGNVQAGTTTTLIACYCWTEDATRMGALIEKDETTLLNLVLRELAGIHNLSIEFLRGQLIGSKGWSWSHDPYTMGEHSIPFQYGRHLIACRSPLPPIRQGAFAFFGPGKFESLYTSLNNPAAKGHLHFAGEAISVRHAWVVGALDSAWRAVHEMLLFPAFQSYQEKFFKNWGLNPEWIKASAAPRAPGDVLNPKDNLVLEHLALTHPHLFLNVADTLIC